MAYLTMETRGVKTEWDLVRTNIAVSRLWHVQNDWPLRIIIAAVDIVIIVEQIMF
jgi:hypothetical protein